MKRLLCAAAMFVLAAFLASPVLAEEAPDAQVKGLWIKATNLPAGAGLEDMTQDDDEPYFIYAFDEGDDGPGVTITVGRSPQNELAAKLAGLDKKALVEFVGSESFAEKVKDLEFTEAPKFSEKFSYPCQMVAYSDSEMGLSHTILFIQTDSYMFSVGVNRVTKIKKYSDADVEKWLMDLEMVEQ